MDAYAETLGRAFDGPRAATSTEENLQARIRGNLLMALSNKFGWLVLTTGNKSEMSVGYTTLYGDLAGGFAVIKDVPKTLVYRLCAWRNSPDAAALRRRPELRSPARSSSAPPSAELRADQRDEDSLAALRHARPHPRRLRRAAPQPRAARRRRACRRRRSSAPRGSSTSPSTSAARRRPGIKVTPLAFGRDRRMPITNRYRG